MSRWALIAYLARYANQPLSELLQLTFTDLMLFKTAISEIVQQENSKGSDKP